MNIQTPVKHTPAEEALIASYGERAADLPGDSTVTLKRDNAVEQLKAGLPTRKVEAWHYTDLRRLLSQVPSFNPAASVEPVAPLLEGSDVLVVANGNADREASLQQVQLSTFAERLSDGSLADLLGSTGQDDTVSAINSALVSDGYVIEIDAGCEVERPIELQNLQAGGQAHARFVVKAGAGAKATIVERQTGSGEALVSSIAHLDVADGAEITWIILQEQPENVTNLGQLNLSIGSNAKATVFVMNAGGSLFARNCGLQPGARAVTSACAA